MLLGVEKEGSKGGTLGVENEGGMLDPGCFAFLRVSQSLNVTHKLHLLHNLESTSLSADMTRLYFLS